MQEINYPENKIFICVDAAQQNELSGTVTHMTLPMGGRFDNAAQMLLRIEAVLQCSGFPEAYTKPRTFASSPVPPHFPLYEHKAPPDTLRGKAATFILQVRFRQNTCWQGTLTYLETNATKKFYSELGCLKIITTALL